MAITVRRLRTSSERLATILLPNAVAQGITGWHDASLGPSKTPVFADFLTQANTGRHDQDRFRKPLLYPTELRDHWFQSLSQVVPCLRALI
jgi:hypothetical protein